MLRTQMSRRCITALALTFTVVLFACESDESETRSAEPGSLQRAVVNHHPSCPAPAGGDIYRHNNLYVAKDVFAGVVGGIGTPGGFCFFHANNAEQSLCSAMEYLAQGVSFNPNTTATTDDRVSSIHRSLYFLHQAVLHVRTGLNPTDQSACDPGVIRTNATYQQYMTTMLAEVSELLQLVVAEGSQLAIGAGDAQRGASGNYETFSRRVWGHYAQDGKLLSSGLRATGFSWYYGQQWEKLNPFSFPEIESVRAVMPACEVNAEDPPIARAIDLLRNYGVPVTQKTSEYTPPLPCFACSPIQETGFLPWQDTSNPQYGSSCLTAAINLERQQAGLADLSYADIQQTYEVDDFALGQAAKYLLQESGVYLIDVRDETVGGCRYLKGFDAQGTDFQVELARAHSGFISLDEAGLSGSPPPPSNLFGLTSIYARLMDLHRCLLPSSAQPSDCLDVAIRDGVGNHPGTTLSSDALANLQTTNANVTGMVGERFIDWEQFYPSLNLRTGNTPTLRIDPAGLDSTERTKLRVYSIPVERNPFQGVNNRYYGLLTCLAYGHQLGGTCNPADFEVCDFSQLSGRCELEIPDIVFTQIPGLPDAFFEPRMFVATLDGVIVDVYAEKRPPDAVSLHVFRTRHFLDDPGVRSEVARAIERMPGSCGVASTTALGLPIHLAVPLENTLTTSGSPGNFEDSFNFYLRRAKDAAVDAGSAVEAALQDDINLATANQQIENALADANDRLEQICGVGRVSCSIDKQDQILLRDLNVLPAIDVPPGCSTEVPQPNLADALILGAASIFDEVVEYVRCSSQLIVDSIGDIPLENLPVDLATAAQAGSLADVNFELFGQGEYRIALLEIKTGLLDLQSATANADTQLQALAPAMEAKRNEFLALQLDVVAAILDAIAKSVGSYGLSAAAGAVKAAAAQFRVFAALQALLVDVISITGRIEQALLDVQRAINRIQAGIDRLALLELEQVQASERAARQGEAILTQYVGGTQGKLKAFRKATLRSFVRARRAIKRAKRMAFIARRALELKLAVNLTQEKEPGVIGDPPAQWVDSLYTMFVSQDVHTEDPQTQLRSYVQRLEDYVFNYPFQYPFADGSDVAVLSLRDDLSLLGLACQIPDPDLRNLVAVSERFDDWTIDGVIGKPLDVVPDVEVGPTGTETTADRLRFICKGVRGGGGIGDEAPIPPGPLPISCQSGVSPGATGDPLDPSVYVGSVHLRATSPTDVELVLIAEYRQESSPTIVVDSFESSPEIVSVTRGWQRLSVMLDSLRSPAADEVVLLYLKITPLATSAGSIELIAWGTQIEAGSPEIGKVPTDYQPTPALVRAPECITQTVEDPWIPGQTTSVTFLPPIERSKRLRNSFRVKCVDDPSALEQSTDDCDAKGGVDYLERSFGITLQDIEEGNILNQGQIGAGNYNYRIDSLAVNLVGSNVKDCSLDPAAGTSCYTNLFIPYDLMQGGSVRIRNHGGVELPFTLAVGRIHEGKAIAAERLLTNPLSSTDSAVVQQYLKNEFKGRPLQGVFTLRIHTTPSFRWNNVEDVQILVNYRYWSPFSNP